MISLKTPNIQIKLSDNHRLVITIHFRNLSMLSPVMGQCQRLLVGMVLNVGSWKFLEIIVGKMASLSISKIQTALSTTAFLFLKIE